MKLCIFVSVLLTVSSGVLSQFFEGKSLFPIDSSYHHGGIASQYLPLDTTQKDQCELYKVGFKQDLYFQYIQYKVGIPELKEFTLCMWNKFSNHSNDHPIFSYAVEGQPRAIYSWVSNTDRSSYYSLAVNGHTFYRLNYPLRTNRWYHSCQSWNGKTGEWQIWVNAERVGRGFHNRLVGHVIPTGGIAITGQEQTQFGGGFQEGPGAPKGAGGMLGEVTMAQLYSVALTAGKAHKDHKHHHVHHFDHNGQAITTPAPPTPAPRTNQPTHPLLTAGQINPALQLNLANQQQQPQPIMIPGQLPNGQQYNAQLVNGQFTGSLVTQQLLGSLPQQQSQQPQQFTQQGGQQPIQQFQQQPNQQFQQQPAAQQSVTFGNGLGFDFQSELQSPGVAQSFVSSSQIGAPIQTSHLQGGSIQGGLTHPSLTNPANVQFIDSSISDHQLFKRNSQTKKNKRQTQADRRELILAGDQIIDDGTSGFGQDYLTGLATFVGNQPVIQQQQQSDEREPAEAEVMAVMKICGGCDEEPFSKALIFGWRTVPKKLYSGAIYAPAVPQCRLF